MADHRPESRSPTIHNLISNLRSSFFATDFENATQKLISREENLKKEYKNNLKKATESLEKKHNDELKMKQTEIDELKKANCELELKIRVSEKRFLDLNVRVLSLEKLGKELMSQQDKNCSPPPATAPARAAENSRQPLVSEKGDSNIKIETKSREVIQLDDDDDDDDDRECISILKRENVSNKRKKVFSSDDDDDTEGTVVFKRRRVSKEIKGDSDEDFIDKIPSGAQKSENLDELHREPVCSRPLSPPSSAKNNPFLEKHEPKTPVFSCDSPENQKSDEDIEKVDDAYIFLSAKLQKERWKSEADMLKDFEKDDDLCLNAICTIKRQNITLHGSDISRANILARWLINGDPQGKLKKKASDLNQDDLDYCRMCARKYVTQFFKVYQTKKDPFFPPQTI